jgi:hypothetical protein
MLSSFKRPLWADPLLKKNAYPDRRPGFFGDAPSQRRDFFQKNMSADFAGGKIFGKTFAPGARRV